MRRLNFLPVVLILFATSVAAMSFSSIIKQAEVIKVNAVTAATNSAITVSTTIRGFAANDPYQIKKLDIPKATYMTRFKAGMGETGGLKGLMKRNAWYAGWLATMAAAGWAIDELTDQVTQKNPNLYKGYVWRGISGPYFSDPIGAVEWHCKYYYGSPTCHDYSVTSVLDIDGKPYQYLGTYHFDPNQSGQAYVSRYNCSEVSNPSQYPSCGADYNPVQDVSDGALYDSLVTAMLQDPEKAAQAFMVPDAWPYPYPQIFPETVPYVPGVAESDEEALNWYLQGLAQSTDPNAAYYVAPDRLQQIAALAQQLQQAQSPEGQAEALNDNLKNPLTQSQLEETLKKRDAANKKEADEISATDKKPITDAYKDSGTKDEFDKLKERVTDPTKLPQLPPLPAVNQIDLPIHTPCRTITMNMFNAVLTFPNPDQCTKLEQVKTGLGYLLYVLTALGIVFELYRRVE